MPGLGATGIRWATTISGTTDTGPVRRTPARIGCNPIMTESATSKATGKAIAANSGTTIVGTATRTTTGTTIGIKWRHLSASFRLGRLTPHGQFAGPPGQLNHERREQVFSTKGIEARDRAKGKTYMNWDQIEGKWKQFSGSARERWGKLTDDDIQTLTGQKDHLVGKIQERYGIAQAEAEKQADAWSRALKVTEPESPAARL